MAERRDDNSGLSGSGVEFDSLYGLTRIAAFAALMAVGAFVNIPLGPVPFSLQTCFVSISGFFLGPKAGLAMALYLAAGLAGLPVFAGGRAGPAVLFGPTGGYLAGFVPAAVICGLSVTRGRGNPGTVSMLVFGFLGSACTLLFGVAGLRLNVFDTWGEAFAVGFAPFAPGGLVKLGIAVALRRMFRSGDGGREKAADA